MKIGIGVSEDLPIERQVELARAVEEAGYTSLWTNEARGRDALLLCQAWGAATERLEVGIGVVPLWTRSPAQLAMGAATLQEATGGRFVLGLGVSHPATMDTWHDAGYRSPLGATRDTLQILRTALDGGTTEHTGEVRSSQRFGLQIDPLPPRPSVLLGAMGPKMLQLAGTHADGVLLNWSGPNEVARARKVVRSAAAGSSEGRAPSRARIAAYVRIAVDEDEEAARRALAREVSRYCALPAYASHFERQGFGPGVEAIKSAYKAGGAASAAGAVPETMLRALGWYGTPDDSPFTTLARFSGAGLEELVARVVVVGDDVDASVRGVLEALRGAEI